MEKSVKVIGLDIGTTSISAAVLEPHTGKTLRAYTVPNGSFLQTGHAWERVQDPALIVAKTQKLLDEILDDYPGAAAIGLTGQMHGIVYTDEDGSCVSPLYTWQDGRGALLDADGKNLCERLKERYGGGFYPGYGLVTHLYNLRHGLVPPGAAKLCTIMDYLGMVLTGRRMPLVHTSNAAGFGFYDLSAADFRREQLEAERISGAVLPELTASIAPLGSYRGVPVAIAIGDNQASFFGSVRHGREEILVNVGTGSQVSMLTDRIVTGDDIEARPFVENSYLAVGASLCGGRAYAALADFFAQCAQAFHTEKIDIYAVMDGMLDTYRNPNHLLIDTAFEGTRDHPERCGSIRNLTTGNFDPASLTYGVLDGIARELYERYQTMRPGAPCSHSRIIGSGNGLRKNAHLQKIVRERFGMQLQLSQCREEAACGAAIAAFTAVSPMTWREVVGI